MYLTDFVKAILDGHVVRPDEVYHHACIYCTSETCFGVVDKEPPIIAAGEATGVVDNPDGKHMTIWTLDKAVRMAVKRGDLPSVCDLAMFDDSENCFTLAELTETESKYLADRVDGNGNTIPGKRTKAFNQLKSTASKIENLTGDFNTKTAVFFHRLPQSRNAIISRNANPFSAIAVNRVAYTLPKDDGFPDWIFKVHPFGQPFTV